MAWYYQVWYTPRWFPAAVLHRPQPQQHGKGPVRLWVTNQQAAADQPTNRNGGWQVNITVDDNIRNNENKEKEVLGAGRTTRAGAEGTKWWYIQIAYAQLSELCYLRGFLLQYKGQLVVIWCSIDLNWKVEGKYMYVVRKMLCYHA